MSTLKDVTAWEDSLVIPTYLPDPPDRNPMFLDKRVYQGSSGKVYPLPFTSRISELKVDWSWKAVWLENEYIQVLVLPEIGGRIHAIVDKTNGLDVIYRQDVIKPALVGLAGPWISGGIEFNWPQHHRPATFLPVQTEIERHDDGSVTVWCSDHDPMTRMKGMHGVCLHPGRATIELKVRVYNRTSFVQTFLWWANVATRVHEGYQSFFPPDVTMVADHAKRALSSYPLCDGHYYGVDYAARELEGVPLDECPSAFQPPACSEGASLSYAPNDLSWYANIPVPTSYMCLHSEKDFFGGYDHFGKSGIVHVADRHISPGKKQWTWGNHEFGYAWDRNLTDHNGPYIELMAGVYTDNQPDFSFLQPGETKTWSQYWYPIQEIGPAHEANIEAAVRLETNGEEVRIGVCVTREQSDVQIILEDEGGAIADWRTSIAPGAPFMVVHRRKTADGYANLTLRVLDGAGNEIITYTPVSLLEEVSARPATEPPAPEQISSIEELYLTGLHLEQYRHATRSPVPYWEESLRRDPLDSRCNNALGLWRLRRGQFSEAETCFQNAISRLTDRNPNPQNGEPYYNLGVCLRLQADSLKSCMDAQSLCDRSYAALAKAAWNQAWASAAHHAMAELDCRNGKWSAAHDHLNASLRLDADNLRVRNLKALVLRKLRRSVDAAELLAETQQLDALDCWSRHIAADIVPGDLQTSLDVAHDYARSGFYTEAIDLLEAAEQTCPAFVLSLPTQSLGAAPILHYTLGWLHIKNGDGAKAYLSYNRALAKSPDYCFPARLEEIAILEYAMCINPADPRAPVYLGNLYFDRSRHDDAIALWEKSTVLDPAYSVPWRNLGIAYFNVTGRRDLSAGAYDKAVSAAPDDSRLLFERDQLWKRLGVSPQIRIEQLQARLDLVSLRDDLSVEFCSLLNDMGRSTEALDILSKRQFQPWEGGEGLALGQYVRTRLLLGKRALSAGFPCEALIHFQKAMASPPNLSEAKHLLANQSHILYWVGKALDAVGRTADAEKAWISSATFKGDFQEMSVRRFSETTYYSALSWKSLGKTGNTRSLLEELIAYAVDLEASMATVDYFATSLPTMLLFNDDLQLRQGLEAKFLRAQALAGLDKVEEASVILGEIRGADPNYTGLIDLMNELGINLEELQ